MLAALAGTRPKSRRQSVAVIKPDFRVKLDRIRCQPNGFNKRDEGVNREPSPLGLQFGQCFGGPLGDKGMLQLVEYGTDLGHGPAVGRSEVDLLGDGHQADLPSEIASKRAID